MTLHEYIKSRPSGEEVTVYDAEYDIEVYFYNDKPEDKWDIAMENLSEPVQITEIMREDVVRVDFSSLIRQKLDSIKKAELFSRCTVGEILVFLPEIISGYVSEEWFMKFVDALK